jgi:hypothetical protein
VSSSKTTRVTEHSVGSARCALSKGMPRGREAFLFKKYFGSEIEEISAAQGVCEGGLILSPEAQEEQCLCAQSNRRKEQKVEKPFEVSELTKLRRGSISIMQMRPKGTRLAREASKAETFERRIYSKGREEVQAQEEEHNCHWIGTGRKDLDH